MRSRRPLPTTFVLLLAAAAIIGYVVGHRHSGGPSAEQRLVSANVLLDYPRGWRPAAAAPEIPALALTNILALAPEGHAGQAGLLVGHLPRGEAGPLPGPFVVRMTQFPDTEVVNLVEVQAYRYTGVVIPGFARKLVVYAIPNPGGEGTVLACYAPASLSAYLRTCQQIVATASLVGQSQLYELTPEPAYARQLSATDARIDRLVYDLYGLTEDEIRLLEGGVE